MDNFFEILIYIIVIVSFIVSFFNKKKKEQEKAQKNRQNKGNSFPQHGGQRGYPQHTPQASRRRGYSQDLPRPGNSAEVSDDDIIKEIENMFKTDFPEEMKTKDLGKTMEKKTLSYKTDPEHTENPEWHTENKEWHTENPEWHSESSEWHTENKEWHSEGKEEHRLDPEWHSLTSRIPKKIKPVTSQIDEEAARFEKMMKQREKEVITFDVRSKLMKPETLKEYVLISEILGKPKALNR